MTKKIECRRCKMVFLMREKPMMGPTAEITRCVYPGCTRRFHHSDGQPYRAYVFMTPDDVISTIHMALDRHANGLPVNNGGCQQGENWI